MNIKKSAVGLATSGAVVVVAGIALAAPASAMVLPGDPPYDGIYPVAPIVDPGTDYGQIVLGAVGGAAVAGAGVATVVLVRRRSSRPVPTA
jgi:hypothetical protein